MFFVQFYFTKTIATMQKSNGKSVAFFDKIETLLSQPLLLYLLDTLTKDKSYYHPYYILHEIW